MKHNRNILSLGLATVGLLGGAYAAPTITGFVEAGYNYNFTIPKGEALNLGHSYDGQSKTFTLNTAHLDIGGSDSATGVGYDVQTDIGSDAKLDASSSGTLFDVQEAYLTYAFGPGRAWGIKAGKYATYEGIEVVEGISDPTITRGFLYGFAEPVTHTGIEASYTASAVVDVHVGLVNGWDNLQDNNTVPTLLGKVGLNWGNPLALTLSGLYGPEVTAANTKDSRLSLDVTGVTHVIPMIDLNFQGNYGNEGKASPGGTLASWYGLGVQPLIHLNAMWAIGARYEFFDDLDGTRTGLGTKTILQNVSVAPTAYINKFLTARVEGRVDFANNNVYYSHGYQVEAAGDLLASF